MDALIAEFTSITGAPTRKAEAYLRVSDANLAQAVQLFFETGGADMEDPPSPIPPPPVPARTTRPGGNSDPIEIDDDELEDDDLREALRVSEGTGGVAEAAAGGAGGSVSSAYDDEALARRLQEEFYSGGGDTNGGVRAPIARTRETLVDDDDYGYSGPAGHMRRRGGMFAYCWFLTQ